MRGTNFNKIYIPIGIVGSIIGVVVYITMCYAKLDNRVEYINKDISKATENIEKVEEDIDEVEDINIRQTMILDRVEKSLAKLEQRL